MIDLAATLKNIQSRVGATPDGVWGPETCRRIAGRFGVPVVGEEPPPTRCYVGDVYHGDDLDVARAVKGGMVALIAKASQGARHTDPKLETFETAANAQGILFGTYHFGNGDDPVEQAEHYLKTALPAPAELVCLDFEASPSDTVMTPDQACVFVQHLHEKLGRWPVIYGGSRLKEELTPKHRAILCQCPLWLSQYGPIPVLPAGWTKYFLWQFTGDCAGPLPHNFYSNGPCLDISRFEGPPAELKKQWS